MERAAVLWSGRRNPPPPLPALTWHTIDCTGGDEQPTCMKKNALRAQISSALFPLASLPAYQSTVT